MSDSRLKTFEIVAAKSNKFVPANQKIEHLKKSISNMQKQLQMVTRSLSKINESKGDPKLKNLREAKMKAFVAFLHASVALNEARIGNLTHPD